jgi:hypothetical protein
MLCLPRESKLQVTRMLEVTGPDDWLLRTKPQA